MDSRLRRYHGRRGGGEVRLIRIFLLSAESTNKTVAAKNGWTTILLGPLLSVPPSYSYVCLDASTSLLYQKKMSAILSYGLRSKAF